MKKAKISKLDKYYPDFRKIRKTEQSLTKETEFLAISWASQKSRSRLKRYVWSSMKRN